MQDPPLSVDTEFDGVPAAVIDRHLCGHVDLRPGARPCLVDQNTVLHFQPGGSPRPIHPQQGALPSEGAKGEGKGGRRIGSGRSESSLLSIAASVPLGRSEPNRL